MNNLRSFYERHPYLAMWIALALGMVIILIWSAWSVGFAALQWLALIVITILLAGACVWIISWEDGPDAEEEAAPPTQADQP
ncbi:MAG: hypothetical protein WAW03_03235 [Anaerolineae bacterium]|uniref:hypothetical protein n=1 Tax=Candidatus Amarolinea dominans TaxID=3140696 RepID=UPI001DFD26AC|nr:hypothetical protein [Anaerolineae bacterium]MBK7200632.1 hypothetical protein [Anaerolineae bacterium]